MKYPICCITCNKYSMCCITCNRIPSLTCNSILKNLSYYLQWNTLSVVLPAMKYPMCRITCKAIPSLTCNSTINLSCRITCNTILNVSYLSPMAALQWFRMFIVFFVEMFMQDYAWLRWQGYTVHERWLGLVEGVDLENVLFSVLKLIDIACGSPWTQAVSWWRSNVSWPVSIVSWWRVVSLGCETCLCRLVTNTE